MPRPQIADLRAPAGIQPQARVVDQAFQILPSAADISEALDLSTLVPSLNAALSSATDLYNEQKLQEARDAVTLRAENQQEYRRKVDAGEIPEAGNIYFRIAEIEAGTFNYLTSLERESQLAIQAALEQSVQIDPETGQPGPKPDFQSIVKGVEDKLRAKAGDTLDTFYGRRVVQDQRPKILARLETAYAQQEAEAQKIRTRETVGLATTHILLDGDGTSPEHLEQIQKQIQFIYQSGIARPAEFFVESGLKPAISERLQAGDYEGARELLNSVRDVKIGTATLDQNPNVIDDLDRLAARIEQDEARDRKIRLQNEADIENEQINSLWDQYGEELAQKTSEGPEAVRKFIQSVVAGGESGIPADVRVAWGATAFRSATSFASESDDSNTFKIAEINLANGNLNAVELVLNDLNNDLTSGQQGELRRLLAKKREVLPFTWQEPNGVVKQSAISRDLQAFERDFESIGADYQTVIQPVRDFYDAEVSGIMAQAEKAAADGNSEEASRIVNDGLAELRVKVREKIDERRDAVKELEEEIAGSQLQYKDLSGKLESARRAGLISQQYSESVQARSALSKLEAFRVGQGTAILQGAFSEARAYIRSLQTSPDFLSRFPGGDAALVVESDGTAYPSDTYGAVVQSIMETASSKIQGAADLVYTKIQNDNIPLSQVPRELRKAIGRELNEFLGIPDPTAFLSSTPDPIDDFEDPVIDEEQDEEEAVAGPEPEVVSNLPAKADAVTSRIRRNDTPEKLAETLRGYGSFSESLERSNTGFFGDAAQEKWGGMSFNNPYRQAARLLKAKEAGQLNASLKASAHARSWQFIDNFLQDESAVLKLDTVTHATKHMGVHWTNIISNRLSGSFDMKGIPEEIQPKGYPLSKKAQEPRPSIKFEPQELAGRLDPTTFPVFWDMADFKSFLAYSENNDVFLRQLANEFGVPWNDRKYQNILEDPRVQSFLSAQHTATLRVSP